MNADSSTIDLTPALSWLKRVAGIDDAYIARWPEAAWVEWALTAVDAQLAIPAALPEPAPAPHRPEHTAYPETGPHSPGPGDTGPNWNR